MAGPEYVTAQIRPKKNNKNYKRNRTSQPISTSICYESHKYGSKVSEKWNDLMPVFIEMRQTVKHLAAPFIFFPNLWHIEFQRIANWS